MSPLTHYNKPHVLVTVDPTDDDDDLTPMVTRLAQRLNGIDSVTMTVSDEWNQIYENTITFDDDIAVYINYREVSDPLVATDLRFYGFVDNLIPSLDAAGGEVLTIHAKSYSKCLTDLLCGDEFGTESRNPTLDTPNEILTDGTHGIIGGWTNFLHQTAASGYTLDMMLIETMPESLKYLYFPYKENNKCIDDLVDIVSALRGATTEGVHWIVRVIETAGPTFTPYFMMATIGAHPGVAPDIAQYWPTWWNTDEAGSTVVVRQDMIVQNLIRQSPAANYVLYHGLLRKPGSELWTEGNQALWDDADLDVILSDDAVTFRVGLESLKADITVAGADANFFYPIGADANWEIDEWGGRYNIPSVSFWFRSDTLPGVSLWWIDLGTNAGDRYYRQFSSAINLVDTWYHISFPMGPFSPMGNLLGNEGWGVVGAPDWHEIDFVGFRANGPNAVAMDWFIDGLQFNGWILRGSKKHKAGGAVEDHYKTMLITDDVGYDDSGLAGDDTYALAQLSQGELFRASRTPVTGSFRIPGKPTALPGQLCHVLAAQYAGTPGTGDYRIDADMRILEHIHMVVGDSYESTWIVTNDLYNGNALRPLTRSAVLAKMINPDFQNRQTSSIKTRGVDNTQAIFETSYNFAETY